MTTTEKKIEDILDVDRRWLPPSPHKEEILKAVDKGAAYIEERGHDVPPLLVFDDGGGVIELPKVRFENTYRGMKLVTGGKVAQSDQTRHPDVCGSVDELKGLLKDQPELVTSEPERLLQLLDDACYMISRMKKRFGAYQQFMSDVASVTGETIEGPGPERAYKAAEGIRDFLKRPEEVKGNLEKLYELAEEMRDVAGKQEKCLSTHKDWAIEIGQLYENIRGSRVWKKEEKQENE